MDRVKEMNPKAYSILCVHQKLILRMLEHGWTINKIGTAVNMEQPVDPGYLVDERTRASYNNKVAEFKYVAVLRTDPVDRSEVHGLRWENIEHAAVLALKGQTWIPWDRGGGSTPILNIDQAEKIADIIRSTEAGKHRPDFVELVGAEFHRGVHDPRDRGC
jgi:hypothetical protein